MDYRPTLGKVCWTLKIVGWLIFVPLLLIYSFNSDLLFSCDKPSQRLLSSFCLLTKWIFNSLKAESSERS